MGKKLGKAQSGFQGPGGGFWSRLKNEGVGSALKGTFPARVAGVWADETANALTGNSTTIRKLGGHVKYKSGGQMKNVPGMYKTGGMYDGMDSPEPRGIYHKSFKRK